MRWLALALPALVLGCVETEPAGLGFISPVDGQTGIEPETPLQVYDELLDNLPPDAELPPNLVRVVNLDDGGFVDGRLVRSGASLLWKPDVPWQANRSYAWVVDTLESSARQPDYQLRSDLAGEATFHTTTSADVLGVVSDGFTLCLLISAEVSVGEITVEIDEELVTVPATETRVVVGGISATLIEESHALPAEVCVSPPGAVPTSGDPVRLWLDGRGPFQDVVSNMTTGMLADSLRRVTE